MLTAIVAHLAPAQRKADSLAPVLSVGQALARERGHALGAERLPQMHDSTHKDRGKLEFI